MKKAFFILALSALGFTAHGAQIYDCKSALESINHVVANSIDDVNEVDLKKQLADITVLQMPLLLTPAYMESMENIFSRLKGDQNYSSYVASLASATKGAKLALVDNAIKVESGVQDNANKDLEMMNLYLWEQLLERYHVTSKDSTVVADRTLESRYALSLGNTHDQYLKIQTLLKTIMQNPKLFFEMRKLIHDTINLRFVINGGWNGPYVASRVTTAEGRKAFFDSLPGRLIYLNANDDAYQKLREIIATNIKINSFEKGEISYTLENGGEEESVTTSLVDLIGLKYPLVWSESFGKATKDVFKNNDIPLKEFFKKIEKSYSRSDRLTLATNIWDHLLGLYDIPVGASVEELRKTVSTSHETKDLAKSLNQSLEQYYKTRFMLQALNANESVRESIVNIISKTLYDAAYLAYNGQPKHPVRSFFDKSHLQKVRVKFLNKIKAKVYGNAPVRSEDEE